MKQTISVIPSNSILFVEDGMEGSIPEVGDANLPAWATPDCIIVKCFPDIDGPTEVTLGDRAEIDVGRAPDFQSVLNTPHRHVAIRQVGDELVLETSVNTTKTIVSIWLSHPHWPERVVIGLG
jgi:hypothetical protein